MIRLRAPAESGQHGRPAGVPGVDRRGTPQYFEGLADLVVGDRRERPTLADPLGGPANADARGYDGPAVPAWAKRLAVPDSETPARSKMAVDQLVARREVHLREKTLWRMLYEAAGRSEEILGVNIEDLNFAGRRCSVKAKGAKSKLRRRGQVGEDFVLETVYWDAGTARLLPRLLKGRTRGPVFVTHRKPAPGKVVSPRDVCPDTGFARLSYGQARALLDEHTAVRGPGTGWDLHEYRHSSLTHLGESGASLLMLMAKSRHKKPENLRRYFKPSPEAIAEVTSLLAPGDSRR